MAASAAAADPGDRSALAQLLRCVGDGAAERAAQRLIGRFGSIGGVMAASPAELRRALPDDAPTAALIVAARAAMLQCLRGRAFAAPMLNGSRALIDYLRLDMAHAPVESARLLFLNADNRLIVDEVMWTGTIDRVPLYVREIVVRALELHAAGLILVHNHPSGEATPSAADIAVTRALADVGRPLGIAVHDHIIVARSGTRSLAMEGLL